MKKRIVTMFFAFLFFFILGCSSVYADTRLCTPFEEGTAKDYLTEIKPHFGNKQVYRPNEKIYVDIKGAEITKDVEISVLIKNADKSRAYVAYLKNLLGEEPIGPYFTIPESYLKPNEVYEVLLYTYYKKTDEIDHYAVTVDTNTQVPVYKDYCADYFATEKLPEGSKAYLLSNSSFSFIGESKKPESREILNSIKLEKDYAPFGGKMVFTVNTTEPIRSAYLVFTNRTKEPFSFFNVNLISDGKGNEFTYTVDAPKFGVNNVGEGTYKLEEIQLYDLNNTRLTYNTNIERAEEYNDKFIELDLSIFLGKQLDDILKESKFELKDVKITKSDVKIGDTADVVFNWYYNSTNMRMLSVMLTFVNSTNGKMFSTYLKELKPESSIIIPSSAEEGEYTLKNVTITFNTYVGEVNAIVFDENNVGDEYKGMFNQKINVKENNESGLYFIAEELQENSYEIIKNSKDNSVIVINADNKSIIPFEVFDSIKDTTKQVIIMYNNNEWVFNGVDVTDSKPIDVSMEFYETNKLETTDEVKNAIGNDAMVLEFSKNGTLPGKSLIRIKDEELTNVLKGNVYYVYYLNENDNKLNKVALELQKSNDGYIEFYINHNSKYVITNKEIKEENVVGDEDGIIKVNSTLNDNKMVESNDKTINYLLMLIPSVLIIILLVIILFVLLSKRNNNKNNDSNNEVKENNSKE